MLCTTPSKVGLGVGGEKFREKLGGKSKSLFLQGIARVILLEMFLSCEGYYDMGMKNGTSMNVKFKKQLQLAN